jgi:hypothetical protein
MKEGLSMIGEDRIERQIDIDASAERVWRLISEPGWWINDGRIIGHRLEQHDGYTLMHDPKHGAFAIQTVEVRRKNIEDNTAGWTIELAAARDAVESQ